ncbi:hypothetical protein [Jidongwangia harbinensis]|uniref:hypothetical protein n=1 Tax=Jidongwangia harbinensis TaxID=2878561 RepID=UPI001CD9376A|nr:hypothetical protein [Jidongwangia harbinensis]
MLSPSAVRSAERAPITWRGALARALRDTITYVAVIVGVISGYFGLKSTGDVSAFVLRVVAAVAVLAIVSRLVYGFFAELLEASRRELEIREDQVDVLIQEIADLRIGFDGWQSRYRGVIERLVDHQSLLYRERLELIVTIGLDDYADTILEKHVTTPTPYLFYRSLRPIAPRKTLIPPTYNDLGLKVDVESDSGMHLTPLPLAESPEGVRVLILFEPPARSDVHWSLGYRPVGLWEPLRRTGIDFLAWDARSPTGRPDDSTFTEFTVRFRFPPGATNIGVQEKNDVGTVERYAEGSWQCVSWRDDAPAGGRYEWTITMTAPDDEGDEQEHGSGGRPGDQETAADR